MYILFSTFQEDETGKGSLFNGIFVSISLLLRPWTVSKNVFNFLISINVNENQLAKTLTFLKEIKALVWVGFGWGFIHLSLHSILHASFRNATKLTCLFPKSLTSLFLKVRRISLKSHFYLI